MVPKTLVTNTSADVEKPIANGATDNLTINNPARVNESSANVAPKTLAVDSLAGANKPIANTAPDNLTIDIPAKVNEPNTSVIPETSLIDTPTGIEPTNNDSREILANDNLLAHTVTVLAGKDTGNSYHKSDSAELTSTSISSEAVAGFLQSSSLSVILHTPVVDVSTPQLSNLLNPEDARKITLSILLYYAR
jgi:hypothetical protein